MRLEFIREDGSLHYCYFYNGCKESFIERVEKLLNVKFNGVIKDA